MNYFAEFFKNLISTLYNKFVYETDEQMKVSEADVSNYQDITKENIIAMVANSLAIYTISDSDISVVGDTKRAEMLQSIIDRYSEQWKKRIADCLGTGMIVSIPYTATVGTERKIFIDSVLKNRFFITGISGDEITSCTVVADYRVRNTNKYIRLTDYSLEGNVYVIRQKAVMNGTQVPLSTLSEWATIPEEIRIGGVDRLPVAIMRCPTSNRRPDVPEGVPVTFGSESILNKIALTLKQIEEEYDAKGVTIFADQTLFGKNEKLSKKYKLTDTDNEKPFFEVFSPEIRSSAYFDKLNNQFKLLEKSIGVSEGTLTDLESVGATATEIKQKMYKTFAFCTDVQSAFEKYFSDLMYGCNVLANYMGITPAGEYEVKYSWSYALLEDSSATIMQYKDGAADGVIKKAEYRQQITGETLEEAQTAIDEIAETEPGLEQLMGKSFGMNSGNDGVVIE